PHCFVIELAGGGTSGVEQPPTNDETNFTTGTPSDTNTANNTVPPTTTQEEGENGTSGEAQQGETDEGGSSGNPIKNTKPSTPAALSPCDNVTMLAGNIIFSWGPSYDKDGDHVTYFLMFTKETENHNFVNLDTSFAKDIEGLSYTPTNISFESGHYEWIVSAYDGKNYSDGSTCEFNVLNPSASAPSATQNTTGVTSNQPVVPSTGSPVTYPNRTDNLPSYNSALNLVQKVIPVEWVVGIIVGILVLMVIFLVHTHFYAKKAGEETAKKLLKQKEAEDRKKLISDLKARKKELNKKLSELAKKEVAGLTAGEISARKAYQQELVQIQESLLNTDDYLKELDARSDKAIQEARAGIPSKTIMKELKEEGYTKKEIEVIKRLFQKKLGKE
ncbi:MAG: hypothetical protein J7L23_01630, partial [Candidatus Diapherotrites archaeon]|nr:hypothetical protein [Candidatus Diapherotrites archaeon]